MRSLFHTAFIAPFKNRERARLYFATIFGCFGHSGSSLFLTYDYATADPALVLAFMTGSILIMGVLLFPLLFMLAAAAGRRTLITTLAVIQILALGSAFPVEHLFSHPVVSAFAIGLILALISAPLWITYHILMVHHTSDDNRGNEVSIANLGISIGAIMGSLSAGFALYFDVVNGYILTCLLFILCATTAMSLMIPRDDMPAAHHKKINIYGTLVRRPWRTLNTIMDGCFNSLIGYLSPVWLKMIGLSGLGVGLVTACQFILKLFISPLTGHWIRRNNGHESQIGSALNIAGWLPWLFSATPFNLVWSYLFWGAGQHMYSVGLQSRWYEDRTYENMAAREVCLGIGRYATILAALPLIYGNIGMFFVFAAALTTVKFIISSRESRTLIPRPK